MFVMRFQLANCGKPYQYFLCVVFRESPDLFRKRSFKNLARSKIRAKQFGGHKAVVRPVPIPNTAVKHSLANGSGCIASARVGCRQSFNKIPGEKSPGNFFDQFLKFNP